MVVAVSQSTSAATYRCLNPFVFGLALFCAFSTAKAQSSAAFATRPYIAPNTVQIPQQVPVPRPAPKLTGQGGVSPTYHGPAPVVMFRATPPITQPQEQQFEEVDEAAPSQPTPRPPYSIIAQSQRDASAWNPASLEAVVAPPVVGGQSDGPLVRRDGTTVPTSNRQLYYRSPIQRILQDTRTSIVYDMPEALADALPWVDRDRKNEPFDAVLARVADDLYRASLHDPEWALGAQSEIRELSKKLDRFPTPPPLQAQPITTVPETQASLNGRPFRARPIWPGASGRPEAQVRPETVVTETGLQQGPHVSGVVGTYVASADDGSVDPPSSPVTRQKPASHPSPTRR